MVECMSIYAILCQIRTTMIEGNVALGYFLSENVSPVIYALSQQISNAVLDRFEFFTLSSDFIAVTLTTNLSHIALDDPEEQH